MSNISYSILFHSLSLYPPFKIPYIFQLLIWSHAQSSNCSTPLPLYLLLFFNALCIIFKLNFKISFLKSEKSPHYTSSQTHDFEIRLNCSYLHHPLFPTEHRFVDKPRRGGGGGGKKRRSRWTLTRPEPSTGKVRVRRMRAR